jgi:hypothetical protein
MIFSIARAQCPEQGLKIQSAACDSPSNARVKTVNCQELTVQWQGSADQQYTILATITDTVSGQTQQTTTTRYSCDAGNCTAKVSVHASEHVTWSVQGSCANNGATFYGTPSQGAPVRVPACLVAQPGTLHVYPNPSSGQLVVDYTGEMSPQTKFTIVDMTGRQVFSLSGQEAARAGNGYKLDLRGLVSGSYLLKVSSPKEERHALFLLIRD